MRLTAPFPSDRPRTVPATLRMLGALAVAWLTVGPSTPAFSAEPAPAEPAAKPAAAKPAADDWKPLFDGKSLDGWKSTRFGGEGEVLVEEGKLIFEMGDPLTGVTWQKEFPKVDFEISLEANRLEGTDFFVGLTFPVRDSHASLIVGGWAGSVVGISSIDSRDASENETTQVMKFKNGQWYKFRLRVRADRLQVWIDEERVVDQDIKDRRISTRNEVNLSKPLGLSSFQTKAALRNIRYRTLKPGE